MSHSFYNDYLESAKMVFLRYKRLGLESINALQEAELNFNQNEANSIAIIVKHLHGNMRSRWTNMFTEDGEKPDRNRDGEFESENLSKESIIQIYHEGWQFLESALAAISEQDFTRPIVIRGERFTLIQAIDRQLAHAAYHIGQIVLIAKQCKGEAWKSLSIPKGMSQEHLHGNYLKK